MDGNRGPNLLEVVAIHDLDTFISLNINPNMVVNRDTGETILMLAAQHGSPEMVEHLIEKGAKINTQDKNGNTALMYAASQFVPYVASEWDNNEADYEADYTIGDEYEILIHLLDSSADATLRNKDGKTALDMLPKTIDEETHRWEAEIRSKLEAKQTTGAALENKKMPSAVAGNITKYLGGRRKTHKLRKMRRLRKRSMKKRYLGSKGSRRK